MSEETNGRFNPWEELPPPNGAGDGEELAVPVEVVMGSYAYEWLAGAAYTVILPLCMWLAWKSVGWFGWDIGTGLHLFWTVVVGVVSWFLLMTHTLVTLALGRSALK